MDVADLLNAVPDYRDFLLAGELSEGSRRLVEQFPEVATLQEIGQSGEGRSIELLKIGNGKRKALLIGVPHPNEPIGTLSLEFLSRVLCERRDLREQLGHTFLIIKVADPDGLALNEGWLKGPFTLSSYVLNYYRCAAAEQVEWGFPVSYKTLRFHSPPPETRAIMTVMERYRPEFCYALHNASFCGVYYYVSRNLPGLFSQFQRLVAGQQLPLHGGEPELPFLEPLAPAVYPFFGARETYDFMEKSLSRDPAPSMTAGTSSADYLERLVRGSLSLVCELPYFTDPALADRSAAGISRRDALNEGMDRVAETVQLIETHFLALEARLPDSRLRRSVADYLVRTPRRLLAHRQTLSEPAYARPASRAEAFDAVVCRSFQPILYLGEVYRLATQASQHGRASEIHALVEAHLGRLEAESSIEILPIKKLVATQVGSGLLALMAASPEPRSA